MKRDNSTFRQKVALRRLTLKHVGAPVVMETHGGLGKIWSACYRTVLDGVVFEKKPERAGFLARQRPTWAVYEADCVAAVRGGAGAHLEVNVLDVDPYGDPWPAIGAFFESERPRAPAVYVMVNDGLRQGVRMCKAWSCGTLAGMVERFGNDLHGVYLDVCQELMKEKASQAGYGLARFAGYYCGHAQMMTHYVAVLELEE